MSSLDKAKDHNAWLLSWFLGYAGLPFAVLKAEVGFKVFGFDEVAEKVDRVNRGGNDFRRG